ncbi:MAG: GNAT family N-acetyltransferase [Candidatus Liptonbacteria bacterium]|nr:GNAT family N-acetyltransferase [Candidatus Liptonbacteria bacterium]
MIKLYENIEAERERIEVAIKRFGRTSDHNLDWWLCIGITPEAAPVFAEWPDGRGLLTHRYENAWRIWSDPLSPEKEMAARVEEFAAFIFEHHPHIELVWCDDVSDKIYPELEKNGTLKLDKVYYSLLWPVMDMASYDPHLSGGHFKEMRNARNKFYREHEVNILQASDVAKDDLYNIVDAWKNGVTKKQKEDVRDLKYHLVIQNDFRGFLTSRVIVADGRPVGFNAGYEVPNRSGRFTSAIGIHDYSLKDLGTILWLEDLEWIKNAGYREFDMQGSEYDWEIKYKTQFGAAVIERKTDTFSIRPSSP